MRWRLLDMTTSTKETMVHLTVYEVIPKEFDGNSDETDHLIQWIAASTEEEVRAYCKNDEKLRDAEIYYIPVHHLDSRVDHIIRAST